MLLYIISALVSSEAKASRIVEAIFEMFGHCYICCRHLGALMHAFYHVGHHKSSKYFGKIVNYIYIDIT